VLLIPIRHLRFPPLAKSLCLVLILGKACFVYATPGKLSPQYPQDLRFELPANGNLRLENQRGDVKVEIWNQNYVSVTTNGEGGQSKEPPATIQRTEGLLSIRIVDAPGKSSRVNLLIRTPARSHVAILASNGRVEVDGISAALLIQTVTGDIQVAVPNEANADVVAESKTGSVTSSLNGPSVNSAARPQLQARLGVGGNTVKLYSRTGRIAIDGSSSAGNPVVDTSRAASQSVDNRLRQTPNLPPDPNDNPASLPPAGTPAKPLSGPEEISEGDIIRVDTQLVSVNVSVVDRGTNRGFNDLNKGDFHLFEDSTEQQIQHFESASAPFNLMLLIDLSGSTTKVVDLIKAAALHFVEAARPFDRISIVTFAATPVVVSPLTTDRRALRERINAIEKPQGSTKLYDSMAFAMDEVFRETKDSRRNAIVVMSDGLDSVLPNVTGEGSRRSYESVIRQMKEFDGVVYSIWVDTQSYEPLSPLDIQQETFDLAHDRMKEFADAGGGAFYECEELKDLAGAYDRVVADLGMLYTLSYRPTNKIRDGSWRTIRVNVARQNAVARGKRGYFAK
jgi:VWFA-related protein